jgi:hypothetical protein
VGVAGKNIGDEARGSIAGENALDGGFGGSQ